MKGGTTNATGTRFMNRSRSGVRRGPSVKNLQPSRRSAGKGGTNMSPIRGADRGGF